MKKKLLFINGHLNTGGVEKSLTDILRHLDYERYEVDLLLLEELGDYAPELPQQVNIHLKSLKNTYGPMVKCLLCAMQQRDWFSIKMRLLFLMMKLFGQKRIALAKKLLTGGKHYDCVIGFRSGICTQIAAFAVNADRRIVWWHHGEINVDRREYMEAAGNCHKIVVVSEVCRAMLAEAFPALEERLHVVPNMLDVSLILKKSEALKPYDRSAGEVQLVTLSRLSPEKHIENAIFVGQKLKEAGVLFKWHIVGGGSQESELKQAIIEADLGNEFVLEGNQSNPYPYLKHADLFVHPSYVESQGLVVLEAMALGIPCVVTRSLGPCEFMKDGTNGLLTQQNPESLAEKTLEMLKDRKLYSHIKDNTNCPEQFLPNHVMQQIGKLLEE